MKVFKNRDHAGELLAQKLKNKVKLGKRGLILAIPRGGIPVAYKLAEELSIPLSIVVVRKLGLPWNEEAGFGAVDPDGETYLDEKTLKYVSLDRKTVEEVLKKELEELRKREKKYIKEGYPNMKNREIIVVDDGIATGYTAIAAAGFAKKRGAKKVTVAVPVCPSDVFEKFVKYTDEVVCYYTCSEPGFAVGMFYEDFHQLSDEETFRYIEEAKRKQLFETGESNRELP